MENQTIARPYAKAVFRFASENNSLEKWSSMLNALAIVSGDELIKRYVSTPTVSRAQRAKTVCEILSDKLDKHGENLVHAMSEYGRLKLMPEVYRQFSLLKAEEEKCREVTVYSVYPLSETEEVNLAAKLSKYFSAEVKLKVEIDKDLIGGIVIKSSGIVIDGSLKGRLLKLADALEI